MAANESVPSSKDLDYEGATAVALDATKLIGNACPVPDIYRVEAISNEAVAHSTTGGHREAIEDRRAGIATALLAASLSLVGAGAANAVGSCTSTPYDYGSGRIYSNCSGVVHVTWKCSTDLWGTLNDRSHNYGAGSVYVFKACDAGYPYSIGFYGV